MWDTSQVCLETNAVEDCALLDFPGNFQFLTFARSCYRKISRYDWDKMVHLALAEIEVHNSNTLVLLNFACMFKFQHVDRKSGLERNRVQLACRNNSRWVSSWQKVLTTKRCQTRRNNKSQVHLFKKKYLLANITPCPHVHLLIIWYIRKLSSHQIYVKNFTEPITLAMIQISQ